MDDGSRVTLSSTSSPSSSIARGRQTGSSGGTTVGSLSYEGAPVLASTIGMQAGVRVSRSR